MIEGEAPFGTSLATPLPAGIMPRGTCARTGVRILSASVPMLFWALRSKAWATSLAEPSPPTQTTLENKKLGKAMQNFKITDNKS